MRDKHSACQLADIIRALHNDIPAIAPNAWKARTLYALMRCRTAEMGGHIDRCDNPDCKMLHLSYNSCRNRHCPRCQGHLRERWIQNREKDLLNASYFHVVFTLPDTLNELALTKPSELYHLLFQTAWSVVRDFAANPKLLGAKTGMVSVLHTLAPLEIQLIGQPVFQIPSSHTAFQIFLTCNCIEFIKRHFIINYLPRHFFTCSNSFATIVLFYPLLHV